MPVFRLLLEMGQFTLLWALATSAGFFVGAKVALPLLADLTDSPFLVLTYNATVGLCVGIAQRLVLGRVMRDHSWQATTVAGFVVSAPFGMNLTSAGDIPGWGGATFLAWLNAATWLGGRWPGVVVSLAVAGAILGMAQWLALRRVVPMAGWWIVSSSIAFAAAPPGAAFLFKNLGLPTVGDYVPLLMAFTLLAGFCVGLVSGAAMAWLLQFDLPESTTSNASS